MKTGFNYIRGSEWRKCDLHFHTPSSYDYQNKAVTNDEIINTLVANGISIVAITDHNTIDVQRIRVLQKIATGRITILPGIELRSELGGSESIHFIGIFPEDWDIEANWIKIQAVCQLTPDILRQKGDERVYCDFKEAAKLFHQLGGLVSVHAGSKANTIENITNTLSSKMALKEDLVIDHVDILEIGKVTDIDNYKQKVFPAIKKTLPMAICSDNHDIRKYELKEICWFKCDPTFAGLRQIIFEPDSRVTIQKTKPEVKTDYLVIDKVRFVDRRAKPDFSQEWIPLNQNLCCVIGGKSSGKTILLHYIARAIDPAQVMERTKGLPLPVYSFHESADFDFEVCWRDGTIMKLKEISTFKRPITYIPQLYINKLAEQRGEQSYYDLTLETLRQNVDFNKFYNATLEKIQKVRSEVSKGVITLFKLIDEARDRKSALEKLGDSGGILKEIKSIEFRIDDLKSKSGFTPDEESQYQDLLAKQQVSENEKTRLQVIIDELKVYKKLIEDIPNDVEYSIEMQTMEFKQKVGNDPEAISLIETIEKSIKEELSRTTQDIATKNFSKIGDYEELLRVTEDGLQKLKVRFDPYLEKFHNQSLLTELRGSLTVQNTLLKEIQAKDKVLATTQERANRTRKELITLYKSLVDSYSEIKTKLEEEQFKKIEDIELKASIVFDVKKFNNQFGTFFDKRHALSELLPGFDSQNEYDYVAENHLTNVQTILDIVLDELKSSKILRTDIKVSDAALKLLDDFFTVRLDLIHNGDPILQMSPGKRGIVLLKLYLHLSNSSSPIFIDQPEDNLDNRTIYTELMNFIEERKSSRQIIIISHNPNVVVSTDSEQVIVCNQDGQQPGRENQSYRFEYVSGSLECQFEDKTPKGILFQKGIREHVCEILEGGEDAFKRRERKYGFR